MVDLRTAVAFSAASRGGVERKDPLGAVLCAIEFVGPCRFAGWDANGDPVAVPHLASWVQTAAVSQDQTRNTMTLFPGLFTDDAIDEFRIDLGKEIIYAESGRRRMESVTSSPRALEGGRSSFTLMNETQHWIKSNEGHEMARVIRRNLAKSRDGQARALAITNAHQVGEDSVAERDWDGWQEIAGGRSRSDSFLYDSIEAPYDTILADRDSLRAALMSARGDSVWLDVERLIEEIYDPTTSVGDSRRFYLNQIVSAEDAWVTGAWVDRNVVKSTLAPGDRVVLFGDGSKSGDDTGLVAVRLSDGFAQTLHHQHPRDGALVDRAQVDAAVEKAFDAYKVMAFWFDPSHAKDDDATEDNRFWWPIVDQWHERYHRKLDKRFWPIKSGNRAHAVAFDMSANAAQQLFQPAVTQAAEDLESGTAPHHGGAALMQHMKNARLREGRFGNLLGKENRGSNNKIDLAICFTGARMLWRIVRLAQKSSGTPGKGRVLIRD